MNYEALKNDLMVAEDLRDANKDALALRGFIAVVKQLIERVDLIDRRVTDLETQMLLSATHLASLVKNVTSTVECLDKILSIQRK